MHRLVNGMNVHCRAKHQQRRAKGGTRKEKTQVTFFFLHVFVYLSPSFGLFFFFFFFFPCVIHYIPDNFHLVSICLLQRRNTCLTRINYRYEASTSDRRHDKHGVHRLFVFGARRSGLDISTASSGLLLATETFEEAKRCSKNATGQGTIQRDRLDEKERERERT